MTTNSDQRRALNPDNVRIGENLRFEFQKFNEKRPQEDRREWAWLAGEVPIHPVTLSKSLAGRAGLSESKIVRLADLLGIHPGRLLANVSDPARFPHIPVATNRNRSDRETKGLAVSSIDSLLKNDAILSHFLGGVDKRDLKLFHRLLLDLREMAREKRELAIKENRYDPVKRKFLGE